MPKPNWGQIGKGAAGGAMQGASFGPWGAAIGGVLGGLGGWLMPGEEGGMQNYSLLTPEQEAALQDYFNNPIQNSALYGAGQSHLLNLLGNSPSAFAGFNAPYIQQFQQQTAPGIAERFAGMGTGAGASSSSGLNNALAQAGSTLQTNLASLRENIRMQALPQALQYAQQPYSNTIAGLNIKAFQPYFQEGTPGFGDQLLGGGMSAMGGMAGGGGGGGGGGFNLPPWLNEMMPIGRGAI